MAVSSTTDSIVSVEEMLSRSKKAVEAGNTAGKSEVEKLLAGREVDEDILDLTPVQKMLKRQEEAVKDQKPYTEQDWFIKMKVNQLRAQLQTFSNLPGLDPNGGVMAGIEAEIKQLVETQQKQLQEATSERQAKAEELAEKRRQAALEPPSPDEMLKRSKTLASGGQLENPLSEGAKALLDNLGNNVDTTA